MKYYKIIGSLAFILLTGCATQYQKVGFTGGFVEKQFSRNEFAVSFSGNGYTTGQRAIDLCMLRCAELALGHDFHYFVLTANNAGYDTSSAVTVGNYIPTGYGGGVFLSTTQTIPKPSASNRILCFREKPTSTTEYFNAESVFDELSQKYGIHKEVETFPKFSLPIATVGANLEITSPPHNLNRQGNSGWLASDEKPHLKIQSFIDGSLAQNSGLQLGDEIRGFDGITISNLSDLNEITSRWVIGQMVQVSIHRQGNDTNLPVKTVFNPALRFKQTKEIKCDANVSEQDVTIIEGSRPTIVAFPVAEYADWENPLESTAAIEPYLKAAAANDGANGVLVLNSQEQIKDVFPNADDRIGFLCSLLIIPKARLGVEFETGTGYENRRVVRRVLAGGENAGSLHIGDNILAVNGIDLVLNVSDAIKDSLKWNIGQDVQVTVARDGKELTFPVKTVENQL